MTDNQCPWLVVNGASGSFSEEAVKEVHSALCTGSAREVKTLDCSTCDLPDASDLADAEITRLAIFAGDGTISNYLGKLEKQGWDGAALLLPGGTTNLLSTELFGNMPAAEIAGKFTRGELEPMERHCLRCESHTALAEILVGPGARWADVREDIRDNAIGDAIRHSIDIAEEAANGDLVRLIDPNTGAADGYPGLLFSLKDEVMVARGYPLRTAGDWIGQGWAMATRDFREGPYDDLGSMEIAHCAIVGEEQRDAKIDLMIDGERQSTGSSTEVRRDTFGIKVFALPGGDTPR